MIDEKELDGAKAQLRKEIMQAYVFLRTKNQTIPSETLDYIKDASLERLDRHSDFDILSECLWSTCFELVDALNNGNSDSIGKSLMALQTLCLRGEQNGFKK